MYNDSTGFKIDAGASTKDIIASLKKQHATRQQARINAQPQNSYVRKKLENMANFEASLDRKVTSTNNQVRELKAKGFTNAQIAHTLNQKSIPKNRIAAVEHFKKLGYSAQMAEQLVPKDYDTKLQEARENGEMEKQSMISQFENNMKF